MSQAWHGRPTILTPQMEADPRRANQDCRCTAWSFTARGGAPSGRDAGDSTPHRHDAWLCMAFGPWHRVGHRPVAPHATVRHVGMMPGCARPLAQIDTIYTQVYKLFSPEGAWGESVKRYFPSKLGKSWFTHWCRLGWGGQVLENVPPVRFKIESNCEGRRKVTCAGYLTAASMVLH